MLPSAILVLLAITLAAFGAFGIWRARLALGWPACPAVVTEASVQEERAVARIPHPLYTPRVCFTFERDGRMYNSDRLTVVPFDYRTSDAKEVAAIVARHPPGMRVQVRVSPTDPAFAVLLPVASPRAQQHYVALVASAVVLLLAALLVRYLNNAA